MKLIWRFRFSELHLAQILGREVLLVGERMMMMVVEGVDGEGREGGNGGGGGEGDGDGGGGCCPFSPSRLF